MYLSDVSTTVESEESGNENSSSGQILPELKTTQSSLPPNPRYDFLIPQIKKFVPEQTLKEMFIYIFWNNVE